MNKIVKEIIKKQYKNAEYVYKRDNIYVIMPTKISPGIGYHLVSRNKLRLSK